MSDGDYSRKMGEEVVSSGMRNAGDHVTEQDARSKSEPNQLVVENEKNHVQLFNLAVARLNIFRSNGDIGEIKKAIDYGTRAIDLAPDGHPDLPLLNNALGVFYTDQFERLGEMDGLDKAIAHFTLALDLTPNTHPDLPRRHDELGVAYTHRFRRLGGLNDLENSIVHLSRALELTPDGHPDLPRRHDELGVSYTDRFQRVGDMNDLEKAINHHSRALDLTPHGHPGLPRQYSELGASHTHRFRRLGNMDDLEKSIEHLSRALDLTPDGHTNLPVRHHLLGASYSDRFRRLGDVNDLKEAIEHFSRALNLTPDGHPELPRRHHLLGVAYGDRFRRLGDINDLENAIEQHARAFDLTPKDHPELPFRHNELGVSYMGRFRRLGDMGDLERAIEHHARALNLTPDSHPDLPLRHHALGVSYGVRFQRVGDMNDLEKAIEHSARALDLTPDGHPDLPRRHHELGVSYGERYRRAGDMNDLEMTIEQLSRALDLTPQGHPDLPSRYNELGVSYSDQFERLGDMNCLEKAIEHLARALDLTPDDHPSLPFLRLSLANSHLSHYKRAKDSVYLNTSLAFFRQASQLSAGPPRNKFQGALTWARYASDYPQLNCLEAYQTAIDLLPQFVWLGATTTQRYQDLLATENLGINATFAAIQHANAGLALEWLEHTRCVVWNQITMLRSPLGELHSSYPNLATRLETVSRQLDDTNSLDTATHASVSVAADPEQIGKQRRRLAQEYGNLLAEARALPGFGDLLRPVRFSSLIRAAHNGPVVAINCHKYRCDALIIMPKQEEIKHVALLNFTEQTATKARSELETSLRRKGLRERGVKLVNQPVFEDRTESVLLLLWNDVVKPILDSLGLTNDVPIDDLPHITWCPTGALSFLPLHAAGDYDQPHSKVFDYVISSYTPTLAALLASTQNSLTRASRVLAVGQAHTPGHTPLPGITTELAFLRAHAQNHAEYSELVDSHATTTSVLDAMGEHDWVHLACHAHQNIVDPTKSGFFLHEGTLDLASISRRSFKKKGLAFLSACQTATGDEKLPDEAIHLASGMLMAGYPSVIATMWSVVDDDAPFVADKVYGELMKEGKVGRGEAGRALHVAVAQLRDKVGEKKFARWVPYIHIGS